MNVNSVAKSKCKFWGLMFAVYILTAFVVRIFTLYILGPKYNIYDGAHLTPWFGWKDNLSFKTPEREYFFLFKIPVMEKINDDTEALLFLGILMLIISIWLPVLITLVLLHGRTMQIAKTESEE